MIRGKRLYQEDLLKMDGERVFVTDETLGEIDIKHTIKLNYESYHVKFNALVDDNERHYDISDMPINKIGDTEVYELIEGEEINTKIRGFQFISKEQFTKDFKETFVDYEDLQPPKRGTKKSACYDIFTQFLIQLEPGEDRKIPTGIKAYMLEDEVLKAFPRSGHGFKFYIRLANTVGIIDADYIESDNEGHIWVKVRNEGSNPCRIEQGEAICQVMFQKYLLADGDNFTDGEQRNGGFGSTTK